MKQIIFSVSHFDSIEIDGYNPNTHFYHVVDKVAPLPFFVVRSRTCRDLGSAEIEAHPYLKELAVNYDSRSGLFSVPVSDSDLHVFNRVEDANKFWSSLMSCKEFLF